ncbi:MAG: hypothetical protein HAW67_01530 [Endozoicomonadaceae bacterium]|nr:hypothetical protein [Endozoicomonadaceae bacterium]
MQNDKMELTSIFNDCHLLPKLINNNKTITKTAKATWNAWAQESAVDRWGRVWLKVESLHSIWRTDKPTVQSFVDRIPRSEKTTHEGERLIRLTAVLNQITLLIDAPIINSRRNNLKYSRKLGIVIQEDATINDKRQNYLGRLDDTRKLLKKRTIAERMLCVDELTMKALDSKNSEFHHIRSQAAYPEYKDSIWNGIVINKETHKIITENGCSDEVDLEYLCSERNWNTIWLDRYQNNLKKLGID